MRNKDEEKVQSSLIPGIRQQEGQLQGELHQVQEEARQLLDLARQEAETSLEKVQGDVSASVDRLRVAGRPVYDPGAAAVSQGEVGVQSY